MLDFLLLALGLIQTGQHDSFMVQAELQGLYDEMSQAALQFITQTDVDQFHDVLYTPDWIFVDATGQRHSWQQMRDPAINTLAGPRLEWIAERIQKLSLVPDGAVAIVNYTAVKPIVDDEGRYGRKGASHTISETTVFRDTWIKSGDTWRLKSREQIGQPKVSVDKPLY